MFYEKALAFAQIQCQSLTTKALQGFQNQLSGVYRQNLSTSALKSTQAMATYAAARMPATYHAVQSCYQHLPADFHPQSLLDLGAGPGTASLAALDYWPSLQRLTLVENHRLMYDFQKALWQNLGQDLNPDLSYQSVHDTIDSLEKLSDEKFDMVVLAYVLGELKPGQQQDAVLQALEKTTKYLLIVTPGTPHDFDYLLKTRNVLLDKGAMIVAPCPHQDRCPLTETKDWCHFNVRLQRSMLHQSAKKGTLGYEDEKFSYLLVAKSAPLAPVMQTRIIRKPIKRPGHIVIDVCTGGQLKREIIGKADPNYKKVSKLEWGDIYPTNPIRG